MAPKSLGLWILLLWILKSVSADGEITDCGNNTGILGKDVKLICCYPGKGLKRNPFRVQWQLQGSDDCVVAAHLPDQSPPPQCECFKNRTSLKEDYLHLWLLNITLEDNKIYECILQKKEKDEYQKIFQGVIRLEVAASESPNTACKLCNLESTTTNPGTHDKQQTQVIAISSLVAPVGIITIIIIILILYKRKHSFYRAYTAPAGMDMS